jgi:hypothetical protein
MTSPLAAADISVDAIVANELRQLSAGERTNITEEMHGVRSLAREETPELVTESLFSLQQEIGRILQTGCVGPRPSGSTMRQKQQPHAHEYYSLEFATAMMNSPYVFHQDTTLKFLRAGLFDPKEASWRMLTHLNLLFKYFGPEALQRPLRFNDLTLQEQDILREGYIQILPSRDRAGKLVLYDKLRIVDPASSKRVCIFDHLLLLFVLVSFASSNAVFLHLIPCLALNIQIRTLLYITSVLSEDVESQKKGFVIIGSVDKEFLEAYWRCSTEMQRDMNSFFQSYPLRVSAIHLCLPSGPVMNMVRALVSLVLLGKSERMRTRVYSEVTEMETQYELLTFGIPVHMLPISSTGTIKTKHFLQWIKIQTYIDNIREMNYSRPGSLGEAFPIVYPALQDVLFSKGGNISHYGNIEFRQLLLTHMEAYNSLSCRVKRKEFRRKIIDSVIQERKGRFLQLHPIGFWFEITDEKVLSDKIHSAFYDQNRKVAAEKNQQKIHSATENFLESQKRRKLNGDSFCNCIV